MAKIGKKLKALREKRSFSVDEIADKLHMSKSNLQKIERDEIEIGRENLDVLLQVYNITYEELQHIDEHNAHDDNNKIEKLWSAYSQTFQEANEELKEVFNKRISELKELYEKICEANQQTILELRNEVQLLKEEKSRLEKENDELKQEIEHLKNGKK